MRGLAIPAAALLAALAWHVPALAGPAEDLAEAMEADDRGDYATAVSRMRALAETGYARAQAAFGTLYVTGHGVPQDFVEAYKWFSVAAARLEPGREHDEAVANRDLVAPKLSPPQIAQANDWAKAWQPR